MRRGESVFDPETGPHVALKREHERRLVEQYARLGLLPKGGKRSLRRRPVLTADGRYFAADVFAAARKLGRTEVTIRNAVHNNKPVCGIRIKMAPKGWQIAKVRQK